MEDFLGSSNSLLDYVYVLIVYGAVLIIMRYANERIELNFRKTFQILFWGWSVGVLIGNYVFFLLGIMSFLPWLNNIIHSFIWIGFCLNFLYAGCYRKPLLEQFALYAIFSFMMKIAENLILGTWELDHFLFIQGNLAYMLGLSIVDGFIPFISRAVLKIISRFTTGIVTG